MPCPTQLKCQCHAEAAGVRGSDQFFGICALAVTEPRVERIRRLLQRSALRGQSPTSVLACAAPDRGRVACDRRHEDLRYACGNQANLAQMLWECNPQPI